MSNEPILFAENRELLEEILQRLAEGETLSSICRDIATHDWKLANLQPYMVRRWTRDYPDFGVEYDAALIDGADALADQMHAIAETISTTEIITEKYIATKKGPKLEERTIKIVDNLERDKLRILVRQYRARMQSSKVRFAERPNMSISGGDGEPIAVEIRGGLPVRPEQPNNLLPKAEGEDPATLSPDAEVG